jgi:hypothetical protein
MRIRNGTGLFLVGALAVLGLAFTDDIVVTNTFGLGFGQIVAGTGSGSVALSPSGARSSLGDVTLGNGLAARAATFAVTGDVAVSYGVSLPSSASLVSGGDSMTIDAFTHDALGVLAGGTEVFHVGATLHVSAAQPSGDYSGSFDVVVTYD